MYLGGKGVHKRTRELTDALWDTLLPAIFGSWIAVCGPILSWAFLISHFSWQPPPSGFEIALAFIISIASIAVGGSLAAPWWKARRVLREHTERLRSETDLRGEGWARD